MSAQPEIGSWYSLRGGERFEVVAIDEDDGTIEIQTYDGTVEEMDMEDWEAQSASGEIEGADAPEDWSGSVDVDDEDDSPSPNSGYEGDSQLSAGYEGLDIFDIPDQFR
jgi:hypothetical protein